MRLNRISVLSLLVGLTALTGWALWYAPAPSPSSARVIPMPDPHADALAFILATDASANPASPLDRKIIALQREVAKNHSHSIALEQLGWLFVEKARRSGNHGYYLLAERSAHALRARPEFADEADLLEGHALLSLHRFAAAEAVAARLVASRGEALDFALYGDTLLDQGRIDDAVKAYERMMRRRPDSRAFARVAEVRLLTGDLEGARDAMRTAARAVGSRNGEASAWIWARLASLELQSGDLEAARQIAESARAAAPYSWQASFALGRILLAQGETEAAIAALEQAAKDVPSVEPLRFLADAYAAAGREVEARQRFLELDAQGASADPRGYSLWLSESGRDPARALALARAELEHRRDVHTWDALAMASLVAGRTDDAAIHMKAALAPGSQDPRIWYHAGLVAEARGRPADAHQWFSKAQSQSALLPLSLQRDLTRRLEAASTDDDPDLPVQNVPIRMEEPR